jgi:hypothetical protein
MNIFQDESGDLGFKRGSSKYFIITLLCPENSKHLGNVVRKFKGRLIKLGWPNTIEIKATHLHMAKHNADIPSAYKYKNSPDIPILEFLQRLASLEVVIDAIVVNKAKINTGLKTLPYGVLYNYYSKNVLVDRIIKYDYAILYIDRTSKQTHKMKHFDDYLYTEALIAKGHNFPFQIEHCDSNVISGISAVDFVAWALSRKFEQKDDAFYKVISGKIGVLKQYYF